MTSDAGDPWLLYTRVAERVAADPAFRAFLITDPRAAISSVLGVEIPEGVDITVHESTPTHVHLAIPPYVPAPDGDLGAISGGSSWKGSPPMPVITKSLS